MTNMVRLNTSSDKKIMRRELILGKQKQKIHKSDAKFVIKKSGYFSKDSKKTNDNNQEKNALKKNKKPPETSSIIETIKPKIETSYDDNQINSASAVILVPQKNSVKNKKILLITLLSSIFILLAIFIPVIASITYVEIPSELNFNDNSLSWRTVDKAKYYILDIDGTEYKTEDTFLDISSFVPKTYNVRICTVKEGERKSKFSNKYKFQINKPSLGVSAVSGVIISKTYDGGNDYLETLKLGEHYLIDDSILKYGKDVDITILDAKFNSANVNEAKKLNISYSTVLKGENSQYYKINEGSFTINAKIVPKEIQVNPSAFVKQFADKDNLTDEIIDADLNEKISINYTRKSGETIGFYDILGATSSSFNYAVSLDIDSGKNKFEIIQRVVDVQGVKDVFVTKVYDGSSVVSSESLPSHIYTIDNIVSGYDVAITMTEGIFEHENVSEFNTLTVNYSAILVDPNGVYKTLKSCFEVLGRIEPKTVKIIPNNFSKEFGNEEELKQNYFNSELNQNIELVFERTKGELIGTYDIVSNSSSSLNYVFEIVEGSGRGKFKIEKRTLSILSTDIHADKYYDGSPIYDGKLEKGIHYNLDGELEGYAVDIKIFTSYFNNFTVENASQITVEIDGALYDPNGIYRIEVHNFSLPATIHPKRIEIEPKTYTKQYGEIDVLADTYFDADTDELISLLYVRGAGETVGQYDILSVESNNSNYEFIIINTLNKLTISKRVLSITPTGATVSKQFDNTDSCNESIIKGTHYTVSNTVNGEETDIEFDSLFNKTDTSADSLILTVSAFTEYSDRYVLENNIIVLPSRITKKQLNIEPQYFFVQYGDTDYMRQTYNDTMLGLSCSISFVRSLGNSVGNYDILSAISNNMNYEFTVVNGKDKYQIAPRILGVEKIGNPTFNKIYDGTTKNNLPILQGIHYNLTNLNGGSSVTLNIISQEYNSKNVNEASKVIVRYTAVLDGIDSSQFITVGGTMEFDAVIAPRQIAVEPNLLNKDYLSDFIIKENVLDSVSQEFVEVFYTTSAGIDHTLTDCGTYDILSVSSLDTNHTFSISQGAGKDKFKINKIHLTIHATNRNTVYNALSQGISEPYTTPSRPLSVKYKLQSASDSLFTSDLPINASTYTARILFEGDLNYLPQYVDRSLFIDRKASVITNTTPSDYVYDGNIKPITATLNHAEATLVFSRNNYINAGTYNYILISVPQTQNFKAASITVSLTIAKCIMKNEDILYPPSNAIFYGQYLYSSILSGGSKLGSFAWAEPNTKPVVADTKFLVNFNVFDSENYDWSGVDKQRYVTITINKAVISEISFPTASGVVYTNTLATSTLSGTSIYGSFAWENAATVPNASGYFNVVFTPYDENNYDFSSILKTKEVYVEVSYRTYFQTNGGSEIASMVLKQITSAPFTFREGYVFDGWYLDETLLKKVEFPLSITADTILYAGWYSEGLIFIKNNGSYSVKLDALTIEQNIFIPSTYRDLPVTAIENDGFRNCTALEMIVIPESVVSIGHNAFAGCVNLAFVQIINGIENINFGIDWVQTGYVYETDVYFNADACPDCDGTTDFHQPGCEQIVKSKV